MIAAPRDAAAQDRDYELEKKMLEVEQAVQVLASDDPGVQRFFDDAYGYAVFPTIGEGGLGIGASHGKGQVYRGGKVIGFTSTTDISIGAQAGGQAYSQIIFFQNEEALNRFTKGNFEFAASASAIAASIASTEAPSVSRWNASTP